MATAENFAKASVGEIREPDNVGHGATREAPTAVPPLPHSGNGGAGNGFPPWRGESPGKETSISPPSAAQARAAESSSRT